MKRKKQTPTPPTVDPFSRWEQFDAKKRAEREEKERQAKAEFDRRLLFSAKLNEDGTFADPQEAEVMRGSGAGRDRTMLVVIGAGGGGEAATPP